MPAMPTTSNYRRPYVESDDGISVAYVVEDDEISIEDITDESVGVGESAPENTGQPVPEGAPAPVSGSSSSSNNRSKKSSSKTSKSSKSKSSKSSKGSELKETVRSFFSRSWGEPSLLTEVCVGDSLKSRPVCDLAAVRTKDGSVSVRHVKSVREKAEKERKDKAKAKERRK